MGFHEVGDGRVGFSLNDLWVTDDLHDDVVTGDLVSDVGDDGLDALAVCVGAGVDRIDENPILVDLAKASE
ncbi:hypothetical protein GCM10025876_31460 [Demequina litorisediminis]|uniref:Uncharacterized protein n=1 Tax=Demequina litorisediminis TaxID=1849022 RepID=A0ABQ6IGA3_9MICO|nr:hypothetical protein GCM10025876_31460 [Demequina litorisediminis]